MLHSNKYRDTYRESLKADFPRVPYPKDLELFRALVRLGREVRNIHLLEHDALESLVTSFPESGDNSVSRSIVKKDFELTGASDEVGRIWINDSQYIGDVPVRAWEFYIGGYQPAQKWLKSRKGRKLDYDDLLHYQKVIVALLETDRVVQEIDNELESAGI
jgi:predicted helicase